MNECVMCLRSCCRQRIRNGA